ncbi:hypothetical protein ACA910_012318 [Epithemia clementina (nom. ined.)]
MESTLIVSAVLEDFYRSNEGLSYSREYGQEQQQKSSSPLAEAIKVLSALIHNATEHSELKYRRVRLQNARIQRAIVSVPGALDILGLAGFRKGHVEGGDDDHKSTTEQTSVAQGENATTRNNDDSNVLVFTDSQQNQEICSIILHNLEAKLAELQSLGIVISSPPSKAPSSSTAKQQPGADGGESNSADDNSPFLSDEERQRRREAAKAARKARAAERTRALQAWREDEEDRKIKACRKEATLKFSPTATSEETANNIIRSGPFFSDLRIRRIAKNPDTTVPDNNNPNLQDEECDAPRSSAMSAASAVAALSMSPATKGTGLTLVAEDLESKPAADEKGKPAAEASASSEQMDVEEAPENMSDAWMEYLKTTPLCAPAEGIRETSVFRENHDFLSVGGSSPPCLRKLFKELDSMNESLPSDPRCSIFVRFDEETPQFLRAMVPAALPGPTPYSGGLFVFDIYVPHNYPQVSPKVELLTTGGGTVRFGPNLYADGKVCLSLLGTWEGPKWQPNISSLNQVLISIQGLVLGSEHPYYLEPGHGGWEGTIKEGSFQRTGHVLKTGGQVHEDIVPIHVAVYENKLRVGTLRFAMIDMLSMVVDTSSYSEEGNANEDDEEYMDDADGSEEVEDYDDDGYEHGTGKVKPSSSSRYLQPFTRPIWVHFHQNRQNILKEVQSWTRDSCVKSSFFELSQHKNDRRAHDWTEEQEKAMSIQQAQLLRQITYLHRKLESVLSIVEVPPANAAEPPLKSVGSVAKSVMDSAKNAADSSAKTTTNNYNAPNDEDKKKPPNNSNPSIEDIHQRMQEAAGSGDYILAGKLQESLKTVEDLQQRMKDAAGECNFIRAGRLQEQLNARLASLKKDVAEPKATPIAAAAHQDDVQFNDEDEEEEQQQQSYGDGDDDYGDDGWNHAMQYGWGEGNQLNSSLSRDEKPTKKPAVQLPPPYKSNRSSGLTCRLRIRLPGELASITEQFDGEDTLFDLYEHIEKFVEPTMQAAEGSIAIAKVAQRKQVMTPYGLQMVNEPAFSRPLSLKGFTLLLAHPKREFSLEIHGTKSLRELGLAPSATLTVMMCQDRGVVRRGDLESRLSEAQGDAMDVEGLSYEGLLELTERVGRKTNETWTTESKAKLESNSTLISPSAYFAGLNAIDTPGQHNSGNDRRCPICLGDFGETDKSNSLRKLNTCLHVYHVACFDTWLLTKSCCPLCNQDIGGGDDHLGKSSASS